MCYQLVTTKIYSDSFRKSVISLFVWKRQHILKIKVFFLRHDSHKAPLRSSQTFKPTKIHWQIQNGTGLTFVSACFNNVLSLDRKCVLREGDPHTSLPKPNASNFIYSFNENLKMNVDFVRKKN